MTNSQQQPPTVVGKVLERYVDPPQDRSGLVKALMGVGGVGHFLWRRRVELAPPALGLALAGIAEAARHTGEPLGPVGNTAVAGGLIAAAMWHYAPRKWDRDAEVMFARWSTVAAAAWVLLVVVRGPETATWWMLAIGILGGGFAWWNHKLPLFNRPDRFTRAWQKDWDYVKNHAKVNVPYSKVQYAEGHDMYARVTIFLGDHSFEEVSKAKEVLAQWLRVGLDVISIQRVEDDAGLAILVLRQRMKINEGVPWEPSLVPASATDLLYLGMREHGEPFRKHQNSHIAVIGATQWGKSFMLSCMIAALMHTRDTVVCMIDLKGGNTSRIWKDGMTLTADNYEDAVLLMTVLNGWIKMRGGSVKTPHQPSPGVPRVVLIFDEVAEGLGKRRPDTRLMMLAEEFVEKGLGLGFFAVFTGQNGGLDTWGTSAIRSQFLTSFVFKTRKRTDGSHMLDDTVLCNPSKIKVKGSYYYHDPVEGDLPDLMRGPNMDPDGDGTLSREILAECLGHLADIEPRLLEAARANWGAHFDRLRPPTKRLFGVAESVGPDAHAPLPSSDAARVPVGDGARAQLPPGAHGDDARAHDGQDARAHDGDAATVDAHDAEDMARTYGGDDRDAFARAADVQAEIDDLFAGRTLNTDDLRVDSAELVAKEDRRAYRFCQLVAHSGADGIKAVEIYSRKDEDGKSFCSRTYVTDRMKVLSEAGLVTSLKGRYYPMKGVAPSTLLDALDRERKNRTGH